MNPSIQHLGKIDNVNLFFDPLRKEDSFLVMQKDAMKIGFFTNEVILESNANIKWQDVTSIIAGFSVIDKFESIKTKINETLR